MVTRRFWAGVLIALTVRAAPNRPVITPEIGSVLERISAESLAASVSFLASDALEGRDTPSRGLDAAAEFIASQFRRVGLKPAVDGGYFQTADWMLRLPDMDTLDLDIQHGARVWTFDARRVTVRFLQALDLAGAGVVRVDPDEGVGGLAADAVSGKAVLTWLPARTNTVEDRAEAGRKLYRLLASLERLKPALVVVADGFEERATPARGRLIDPKRPGSSPPPPPTVVVHSPAFAGAVRAMPAGAVPQASLTLRIGPPVDTPARLRNVVGTIPGTDPRLADTYVVVSAHYDHVGVAPAGDGDRIFNGANDDASGTAALIELAGALVRSKPRRTVVFLAVFGEEAGLLGTRYYIRNPVFPLAKTVANVNLEHLGRTDSGEGAQLARAMFTGFDYSDLPKAFQAAGELTGVEVYDHPQGGSFFNRSDNVAFANAGIPAHTVCVALEFPDYHGTGDHWDKIDYGNMAKVARMLGTGVLMLANNAEAPRWNAANPKTERYRKALEKREPAPPVTQ